MNPDENNEQQPENGHVKATHTAQERESPDIVHYTEGSSCLLSQHFPTEQISKSLPSSICSCKLGQIRKAAVSTDQAAVCRPLVQRLLQTVYAKSNESPAACTCIS